MAIDYEKNSQLLKVLGHPTRLKIVESLINNECEVNKIVIMFNIPQSTVSHHLSILKAREIVRAHKEGVKTCYKVVDKKTKGIIKILKG